MNDVLIVEDDYMIADLLQTALQANGYTVTGIARTVAEAMEIATRSEPDFAIVDVNLAHGESGAEVGRRLRGASAVRVLFSTGKDRSHGLTANEGHAVMLKPYRMSDIGRGLEIIGEMARSGRTALEFPRGFALLEPAISAGANP